MDNNIESPSSGLLQLLSQDLLKALKNEKTEFREMNYIMPEVIDERKDKIPSKFPYRQIGKPRLPKRVALPLVEFPVEFKEYLDTGNFNVLNGFLATKLPDLCRMRDRIMELREEFKYEDTELSYDMDNLLKWVRQEMTHRNKIESKVAHVIAKRAIKDDLKLISMRNDIQIPVIGNLPIWPSFLHLIQRMRAHTASNTGKYKERVKEMYFEEGNIKCFLTRSGEIFTYSEYKHQQFIIYCNQTYFYLKNKNDRIALIGDMDTMDYLVTHLEILFNLSIIEQNSEYTNISNIIKSLRELENLKITYNDKVAIMKGFEALCLMKSDMIDSEFISWAPIIDTIDGIIEAYKGERKTKQPRELFYAIFTAKHGIKNKGDWLETLLYNLNKLEGQELQEISSLHKFHYYSQIVEEEGMKKYLKRVHTMRPCTPERIENLVCLAKQIFTINYHKRHNIIPNLTGNIVKIQILKDLSKTKNYKKIQNYQLQWWEDINIELSLSKPSTHDPLEKAKDKGALLPEISHGPGDSKKELLQIIERKHYNLKPLPLENYKEIKEQKVIRRRQDQYKKRYDNVTRLIMKEREQKKEGRLFGNTTIDNKHGLSYYMDLMKLVLSYFDGELMTISDKQRKLMLHEAGQLLKQKNYYSILLDIEGHNQSMQYHNVGPLAEFCGKLFGEDNWRLLSNYFNHLHVYYYHIYKDDVIISEGQKGGIEGWQNPLWTLHTTLIVTLMIRELKWNAPYSMIYSDDVAIVTEINFKKQEQLDDFFKEIVDFFFDFGMCVKPAQTVVSKNRVTILRNHYFKGIKSDSTLKRLLSSSSFNDDQLVSEEIEAAALNSSVSSAMEYTNHLLTCLAMKWYKGILMCSRPLVALLEKERKNSLLNEEILGGELQAMLGQYNLQKDITWILGDVKVINSMKDAIKLGQKLGVTKFTAKDIYKLLTETYGDNMELKVKRMHVDLLYYYLKDKEILQELLIYRMIMPCNLGGYGFSLGINQVLSGHSNGFIKQIYYTKEYIKMNFKYKNFFYTCLEHSLGKKYRSAEEKTEASLIGSEFPIPNDLQTATQHINNSIKNFIKFKSVNEKINKLLELESNRGEFQRNLMNLTANSFSYRIARFYYEHSKYHILDLLLAKIESSRGFLKLIKGIDKLRSKLFSLSLIAGEFLFQKSNHTFGMINDDTDMVEYMINHRQEQFTTIKFINITEPLYDNQLYRTNDKDSLIISHYHRGTKIHEGVEQYLAPEFGNEALYKAEESESVTLFEHIEQLLIFKTLMMTKWIIFNSLRAEEITYNIKESNIVKMADYVLLTFNAPTYLQLETLVHLPTGGEILHRLPNMQFRTSSNIRVMPAVTAKTSTTINQNTVYKLNLEDTNINFDYIRMRIQIACALQYHYGAEPEFITRTGLVINSTMENVQISFLADSTNRNIYDKFPYRKQEYYPIKIEETRLLCETYFTEENMIKAAARPTMILYITENERQMMNKTEIILQEYYSLRSERLFLNNILCEKDAWIPFIRRYQRMIPDWSGMEDDHIYIDICSTLHIALRDKVNPVLRLHEDIDMQALIKILIQELELEMVSDDHIVSTLWSEKQRTEIQDDLIKWRAKFNKYRTMANWNEDRANALLFQVLQLIVVKHCLVASIDHDGVSINIIETNQNMMNCVALKDELLPTDTIEGFCINLYGSNMVRLYIEKYGDLIVNEVAYAANLIDWTEICYVRLEKEKDLHNYINNRYPIPTACHAIKYRFMTIDNTFITKRVEYNKLFQLSRHISSLYADPDTYFSPTGSDSYVGNYGILKTLKDKNWIDNTTYICDLTAGRGDARLAAESLDLKIDSYTPTGIFTKISRAEGVVEVENLDIFDQESIMFSLRYEHIHIDISHIKGETNKADDLLKYLISNKKQFSLRINNFYKLINNMDWLFNQSNYEIYLAIPNSGELLPYQMYIVCRPGKQIIINDIQNIEESRIYKTILTNYCTYMKYNNILNTEAKDVDNSATAIISDNLTLDEFITHMDEHLEDDKILESIKKVLRNWTLVQNIELAKDGLKKSIYEKLDGNIISSTAIDYTKWEISETTIGFKKNSRKYNLYKKHLRSLKLMNSERKVLKFSELKRDNLLDIRQFHPLQTIRSTANAILNLLEANINVTQMELPEIKEAKIEYTSETTIGDNAWSKSYKDALLILSYSIMSGSYSEGLKILLADYHGDYKTRKITQQKIEIYRKLGKLYNRWSKNLILSYDAILKRDKIKLLLTERIARKAIHEKERSQEVINDWTFDEKIELPENFYTDFLKQFENIPLEGNMIAHTSLFNEEQDNETILINTSKTVENAMMSIETIIDMGELTTKLQAALEEGSDEEDLLEWAGGDMW